MAELTWSEFKVDLRQMHATIGTVTHESGLIEGYMNQIAGLLSQVKADWVSPSELSFEDVQQWFTRVQADLHALLQETIRRLQTAYDNYHQAELANTSNVQGNGHGGGHGDGGGSGGSNGGSHAARQMLRGPAASRPAHEALLREGAESVRPAGRLLRLEP